MDQCMVDVTDTDVAVGDEVTLFGSHPEDIAALARLAHTIPYEVLCLVSARVPRRYV
jgi:alanine racemase